MSTLYVQCSLERASENGIQSLVSWIPKSKAQAGRLLKLKDSHTKEWSDGWKVLHVGRFVRSESEVIAHRNDWKKTRKASDI